MEAVPAPETGAVEDTDALRVLVVDDEEVVRQIAGTMIEAAGWERLEAADGPTALRIFREVQGMPVTERDE